MKYFDFKRDKYKHARGPYSRLLNLYCRKCKNLLAVYQKDGPGSLRRLYLDRIFAPEKLSNLQARRIKEIVSLKCRACKELLGTPCIYQKEGRKAFRLYQDALIKKVRKLK